VTLARCLGCLALAVTLLGSCRPHAAEAELVGAADSTVGARIGVLHGQVAAERRRYEELATRMAEMAAPDAALLGARPMSAEAVLAHLRPAEALVEYQITQDSLFIFVGRSLGLTVVAVPLPPGGLQGRVRLARELVAQWGAGLTRMLPVLGGLGDILVAPVRRAGALDGVRLLILVPYGVLSYLPFAAVVDSVTGHFLVEDFALMTVPSASSLVALREAHEREGPAGAAVVLAPVPDELPGTAFEAHRVAGALSNARLLVGGRATEPAVRASLMAGGLVHLATHGQLNSLNPMFSGIETAASGDARDPADDGRLEVHEILGLRVHSPLVFLSGCETGVGGAWSSGFAVGQDFATLSRAFLFAGARNVMSTLWRVDDRGAAELAMRFYQHFPAAPAAEALASAQKELLADPKWRAPYYWAGYVLSGGGGNGIDAQNGRVLSVK
jgi:hypothetical protein